MAEGGSAFPYFRQWENERKGYMEQEREDGMSLRDYFAAAALQLVPKAEHQSAIFEKPGVGENWTPEGAARLAYRIADAMLAARESE